MDGIRNEAIPGIVKYYDSLPLPSTSQPDPYKTTIESATQSSDCQSFIFFGHANFRGLPLNRVDVGHGQRDTAYIIGKGNKPRLIHIRPYAQSAIQAYLAERMDTSPSTNSVWFVSC